MGTVLEPATFPAVISALPETVAPGTVVPAAMLPVVRFASAVTVEPGTVVAAMTVVGVTSAPPAIETVGVGTNA